MTGRTSRDSGSTERALLLALVALSFGCSGASEPAPPQAPPAHEPDPIPVAVAEDEREPAPIAPADAPVDAPIAPAPITEPSAWRAALADPSSIGCRLFAMEGDAVAWGRASTAVDEWVDSDRDGPLPDVGDAIPDEITADVARGRFWVPISSALCHALHGPVILVGQSELAFVGRRLTGCSGPGPIAFSCGASSTPPDDLRFEWLHFGDVEEIDESDAVVASVMADLPSLMSPRARRGYARRLASEMFVARRMRSATIAVGVDELRALEIAVGFFESEEADSESFAGEELVGAVLVRSGTTWTRATTGIGYRGVLHAADQIVGLVEEGHAPTARCAGAGHCGTYEIHPRTGDATFGDGPSAIHGHGEGVPPVISPVSYYYGEDGLDD